MEKNGKGITALGFDLSTTALSAVGRAPGGEEVFVSIPMKGQTTWYGEPAFDLNELPGLFIAALNLIEQLGFEFAADGSFSLSVRQHDMLLLDKDYRPLMAALSWQCDAAEEETETLKAMGTEAIVGKIEPRFILPKLLWALKTNPDLRPKVRWVLTTGDYIAFVLTNRMFLATSDALSNGLLRQETHELAVEILSELNAEGISPILFPPVIKSGKSIGRVYSTIDQWKQIRDKLDGWQVIAGLGDNHAGAVGSGLANQNAIVISAGTSGTVTRVVKAGTSCKGEAARFDYYGDTLLLMMLHDCGSLYKRFVERFGEEKSYKELDALTPQGKKIVPFNHPKDGEDPFEGYFVSGTTLAEKVVSVQNYIASKLIELFELMLEESNGDDITSVVLTGGLSSSAYFRNCFRTVISKRWGIPIRVSQRTGPLSSQAATLGALINALVGGGQFPSREAAMRELCPTTEL